MKALMFVTALCLSFITTASNAQAAEDVKGHWLTENKRAVIQIEDCEDTICGSIYWIIEGGMQFDGKNPLPMLRKTPLCGYKILKDFNKTSANSWENGTIYKADDGDTYKANMKIQEGGTLKVRGYRGIPMFGKSQIWERVEQGAYERCEALE